jgi:hypothetical protein
LGSTIEREPNCVSIAAVCAMIWLVLNLQFVRWSYILNRSTCEWTKTVSERNLQEEFIFTKKIIMSRRCVLQKFKQRPIINLAISGTVLWRAFLRYFVNYNNVMSKFCRWSVLRSFMQCLTNVM